MRILFFITGHRHLDEYKIQSQLFNNFKHFNNFEVVIHSNSNLSEDSISKYTEGLNCKILSNQRNTGYVHGLFTALEEQFDVFNSYDCVVHLHPDVFITNDRFLYGNIKTMIRFNFDILTSYQIHTKHQIKGLGDGDEVENLFYSTNLFAFNPKRVSKELFSTNNSDGLWAEHLFTRNIVNNNYSTYIFERQSCFNNPDFTSPFDKNNKDVWDNSGIIHTHDLESLKNELNL